MFVSKQNENDRSAANGLPNYFIKCLTQASNYDAIKAAPQSREAGICPK